MRAGPFGKRTREELWALAAAHAQGPLEEPGIRALRALLAARAAGQHWSEGEPNAGPGFAERR